MQRPVLRHVVLAGAIITSTAHIVGSLRSGDLAGNGDSWALGVVAVGQTALGWLILGRRPGLRMGWLFSCGGAFCCVAFLSDWWAKETLVHAPGSLPFGAFAAWWSTWSAPLPVALLVVAPLLLFPNGVARSQRWRRFIVLVTVPFVGLVFGSAVLATAVAIRTPLMLTNSNARTAGSSADRAIGLSSVGWLLAAATAFVAVAGVLFARRRAVGDLRRQCTTVVIGVGVLLTAMVATSLVGPLTGQRHEAPEALAAVLWLAIPTAVAVAIVRYRLFELRVLVSRSILVLGVGGLLTGAYFGVLLAAEWVAGSSTKVSAASLVAAAVVGLVSVFVAAGISANTRRWFGRATGVHVVAARFDDGGHPDDDTVVTLQRLVATVKDELRLGSVTLTVDGGATVRVGDPEGPVTSVVLEHAGRSSGALVVTPRRGEALSGRDRDLLDQIGRYVALTAAAIRANDDLRAAQEALRRAHIEERRRLRMDLHDGLGPTLAAIRLKLVAYARHASDPFTVTEIADQTADAIREVRRIVEGLQPSLLEDLGLVAAVQILVADTSQITGICFKVDAPDELDVLPATIAATAYRAISEGIANVTRHSGARTCTVTISLRDGLLDTSVADDGRGFDPGTAGGGVGLHSIRARARAVGGDATIASGFGRGTVVSARFPIGVKS